MDLDTSVLIKFHRNTGKIDLVLEGEKADLLTKWAKQNLKAKSKDIIIANKETGIVIVYYEGTGE